MNQTPAPWNMAPLYLWSKSFRIFGRHPTDWTQTLNVAEVWKEEDARLVVSAPALLTLLKAAVAYVQPSPAPLGPPMHEHVDVWPEWVKDARLLIDLIEKGEVK